MSFSITIIPHCLNQRDDILMGGRDETDILKTVLQRAKDHGITLKRKKYPFRKEQI